MYLPVRELFVRGEVSSECAPQDLVSNEEREGQFLCFVVNDLCNKLRERWVITVICDLILIDFESSLFRQL